MESDKVLNLPRKLDAKYTTSQSRANTIVILGSSRPAQNIIEYMDLCGCVVRDLVLSGKNIIHGCGGGGIMGAANRAGAQYSMRDENYVPVQNRAIITVPMWGDEDLENSHIIATAHNEADRIEKFISVADCFLIFPGAITTLQEATTLIAKNHYAGPDTMREIILVGRGHFSGLITQYQDLYNAKLVKRPLHELFRVADINDIEKYICDICRHQR